MTFTGQWHNREYAGEGLTAIEYPDGKVIGYFFTYRTDGFPLWLMCVGNREGDKVEMQAWKYHGGRMGDKAALKLRTETEWGKVRLTEMGGSVIIAFESEGRKWGYETEALYSARPSIKIQKVGSDTFQKVPMISNARLPTEYLITSDSQATVTRATASGKYNPRIIGLREYDILRPGKPVQVRFDCDPGWKQQGAHYDWIVFEIHVDGEEIMRLGVKVEP